MSSIEKKLERAEEKAEEIWKEMYQPEKTETEPPKAEEPPKPEVVEETPAEPEAPVTEEPPAPEPVAPEPEKPKPPEKSDTTDWKQKYQTLDGKYKAEVPRLSAEVGQWKEYAQTLSKRVSELEETVKKPPKEEADPDMEAVAESNPEFVKIIKKMKEEHRDEIAALRKEFETGISADIKSVKDDIQLSKQDRFDIDMQREVGSNWREIDNDPQFHEWLNAPVPYARATKMQLLQAAARDLDSRTVAQFFLDFKASLAPEPDGNVEPPAQNLEKFTAPPRSGAAPIPKRTAQGVTKADYMKFMDPRYRFNPKDWGGKTETQMEAIFDAAIQKGTLL